MNNVKVLLHTCCAPCLIGSLIYIGDNIDMAFYWYNPNIHPQSEYIKRKEALEEYSRQIGIDVIYKDEYGLREFVTNVVNDMENRCEYCYRVRLEETAKCAKENGFWAFSTTLLISPFQKQDMIRKIGEEIAQKYEIKFAYVDFRGGFRKGHNKARELGLYKQKYCGCIFSEERV